MPWHHEGRISASLKMLEIFIVLSLSLPYYVISKDTITSPTTHIVGDSSGWTFNIESWSNGKKFKAGDILVFNYDPSLHNVAIVDANGYKNCTSSPSSQTYSSGKDRLRLSKGQNYFICGILGHCDVGVKIAANAS